MQQSFHYEQIYSVLPTMVFISRLVKKNSKGLLSDLLPKIRSLQIANFAEKL